MAVYSGSIDLTERSFDAGEVVLNYAEGPATGPALVLLHGGSARWQYFLPLIPDLARQWQVYAVDLRGHGESGRVPGRYALRHYASDICAFLAGVSGPAFVFGHSLGGLVAEMAAAACPPLHRALLLGDSPLSAASWATAMAGQQAQQQSWRALSGGRITVKEIQAALRDAPMGSPDGSTPLRMRDVYGDEHPIYAWLAGNLYRHDPDVLGAILDQYDDTAAGLDPETLLPAISCPVLLLQADPAMGAALSDADVAQAMHLLARPEHIRLAGVSHVLWVDDKAAVLAAVQKFQRNAG